MSILDQLVDLENVDDKKFPERSPASSPSIVYSDDDAENDFSNVSCLRSQPVLQVHAEDDSILGNKFSDDEIDDQDHFILSQSLAHGGNVNLFSSSEYVMLQVSKSFKCWNDLAFVYHPRRYFRNSYPAASKKFLGT